MPPDLRRSVPLSDAFYIAGLDDYSEEVATPAYESGAPELAAIHDGEAALGGPALPNRCASLALASFPRARCRCAGSALWFMSHRCRSRTVEVDSSDADSDELSSLLSGPASPTSPSYTPSSRNSSPPRLAGACPPVAPDLEPFRAFELPRTVTLLPGESFPATALGSQPALDGSDWLAMCLHTLTAALGEPCSVVIEARAPVPPAHTL
jgi:hypothetical protein